MNIKRQAMGAYQTNCYIVEVNNKEVIIDPGMGATSWVLENVTNPIAILNTHGHFDHVWSNKELKEKLDIPIYAPEGDIFMLENDPSGYGTPPSHADIVVKEDKEYNLDDFYFSYLHFPGHTPGCSGILIKDSFFSGDFIFHNSIGRVDFPFSSPDDMKDSIYKFLKVKENWTVYPGHGEDTSVFAEQKNLPMWINMI